jgi:hypothetical protein
MALGLPASVCVWSWGLGGVVQRSERAARLIRRPRVCVCVCTPLLGSNGQIS